ncbi:MAG: HAD family hydrolase [Eubacterium sp.]
MRETITIHTADIQGAIFDVDGTLLDSMPAWHDAGARFLKTLGIEAEPNLGDILFAETTSSGADYMIRRYHLQMTKDEVAEGIIAQMDAFYRDEVQPKPGAVTLLKTLKETGIPAVVVTSTEGSCIEEAFSRLQLHPYFRSIFSAQDLHTTKKDKPIWDMASAALGADTEKTWVFEDGLYAIEAAGNLGYRTLGLYDRISEADQEQIREKADLYIRDLRDLEIR